VSGVTILALASLWYLTLTNFLNMLFWELEMSVLENIRC